MVSFCETVKTLSQKGPIWNLRKTRQRAMDGAAAQLTFEDKSLRYKLTRVKCYRITLLRPFFKKQVGYKKLKMSSKLRKVHFL